MSATAAGTTNFFGTASNDSPQPIMLEPTHDMMERFQIALKRHLLREKQKLTEYVAEMRHDLKNIEKNEDDAGGQLVVVKQEVDAQQRIIEIKREKLTKLIQHKILIHDEQMDSKALIKSERISYEEQTCIEEDLRTEVERLHRLEKTMMKWKEEMENDLAVNLRVTEKTEADRKNLLEANRNMDMYIFRLLSEIRKLESLARIFDVEIERGEEYKRSLKEVTRNAQSDLQTLTADTKRVMSMWNGMIVAIKHKDESFTGVTCELIATKEEFRNLNTEIESLKKLGEDNIGRSEELGLDMAQLKAEMEKSYKKMKNLLLQRIDLEQNVMETMELGIQAERDLGLTEMQVKTKESELRNVQIELDEYNLSKRHLEDTCLSLLIEQSVHDKAAMYLNKMVRKLRDKAIEDELQFAETASRIFLLGKETEEAMIDTARNQEILEEMNKDLSEKQAQFDCTEMYVRDIQNRITKCQGKLIIFARKMDELAANARLDKLGKTPIEIQIQELEWKLQDFGKENATLQERWMRQQQNNIKHTVQRTDQVKEINLIRKQIILLEQKNMKINEELEQEQELEAEIKRTIANLQHRLTVLCTELAAKSGTRDHADKRLLLQQTEFINSLKDAEHQQISLKNEIRDLEKCLEERANVILERHRDLLMWKKKVKIASETKEVIQKEKSNQGDIGQMRLEIHRMEVRFTQLRKVQDKLMNDLEHTVRRREAIVDEADVRERRERGTNHSRANFQRKMDEMRHRLKMLRQERKMNEKLIAEAETNHNELFTEMNDKIKQVKKLQDDVKKLDYEMQDSQLNYLQSVEVLVRRQRKCKLYCDLKLSKYRAVYKNELTLEHELGVARSINSDLTTIAEALMADFPQYRVTFRKIFNTLKPDDVI